jgi:uncharacterized protein YjbJ (UPF0337 family)
LTVPRNVFNKPQDLTINIKSQNLTTLEIKGGLNIIKGKLKQKGAKLTGDKLQCAEGESEELLGRIQKRTSEASEAIKKAVNSFCFSNALLPKKTFK